ncbi:MAG: flippase-like domain-containing protein [Dehalococcoidia bacterium]|nr:flippase-like domain-containing protein [Dehalococcoidia bacterium]
MTFLPGPGSARSAPLLRRGSVLRGAVGIAISVGSMWLLLRAVDGQASLDILRGADRTLVGLAVTCLFVSLAAKIARWRALLPPRGTSFPRLFGIVHISMFLNNVLPLRVGDAVRAGMTVRSQGVRLTHVVSSMVAERVLDAATLIVCFLLVTPFLPYSPLRLDVTRYLVPTAAAGALVMLAGAGLLVLRRRAEGLWSRLGPVLSAVGDSWRRVLSTEGWTIWGWSALAWATAFAINFVLFRALHMEVSPAVAIVLGCSTNLAMLVPSSPAQIGVYHAAATLTLVAFGVDRSVAVSFSVLSHLVNVVPVSLVGAAFLVAELTVRRPRRAAGEASEAP